MVRNRHSRDAVLKASHDYYAHRAYYEDLLDQGASTRARIKRELDFLEFIFRIHATHQVKDVLDVACGNGRHAIGLARRGYNCTGSDYTPERIHVAKARAQHEHLSLKLLEGDATKLAYDNEFDATLALYILFLLPDDEDVQKCLRQIYRSLKPGGITICNVFNPLSEQNQTHMQAYHINKTSARGIRCIDIDRVKIYDRVHGITWWDETSVIEAHDSIHVFRDHERIRLFTYWEILHYLQTTGFEEIKCYPDWKIKPSRKPTADQLVFVAQKAS